MNAVRLDSVPTRRHHLSLGPGSEWWWRWWGGGSHGDDGDGDGDGGNDGDGGYGDYADCGDKFDIRVQV